MPFGGLILRANSLPVWERVFLCDELVSAAHIKSIQQVTAEKRRT